MLRTLLEGIFTIGITVLMLWILWKLLPGQIKVMGGIGLVLVGLFFILNVISPAPDVAPTGPAVVQAPSWPGEDGKAAELIRVAPIYSTRSLVRPRIRG